MAERYIREKGILLSGHESESHGYPLIRKPILTSDLQRVVAETSGPAKGR